MERERLAPLVVALLAVLALAVGAATLDSANSGSLVGPSEGSGVAEGPNERANFDRAPAVDAADRGGLLETLFRIALTVVVVTWFLAMLYWIKKEGLDALKATAMGMLAFVALLLFAYFFRLPRFGGTSNGSPRNDSFAPSGGGGGGGTGEVTQVTTDPTALLVAVFTVVLVGAVGVVLARSSRETTDEFEAPEPEPDPDPSVQAVGNAAGRAADRIDESGDVENAVYRAWREMTTPLDLPRETTTPGEFAAAAVDAGMSREDVTELTRLFETTRYGGRAVDETREERATTALRRIERTYGDDR